MPTDNIEILVEAKVGQALKGLGLVEKKTEQTEKKQSSLLSKMKSGWVAVGSAIVAGGVIAGMKKVISLYIEQERAEKNLAAAMKQAGTYTEKAFKHNLNYASSLQKMTTYGDEAILSVQKQLSNFKIEGKALDELTKATLDLAAAKGMDLKSAGDLVAKSVGSSTNALSRYGITIEGAAGSTERATQAVQAISDLFGGAAQAEAATFGGQVQQLSNAWGDLLEIVGGFLANAMQPLVSGFSSLVGYVTEFAAGSDKATDEVIKQQLAFNKQIDVLKNLEAPMEDRKKALIETNKVLKELGVEEIKEIDNLKEIAEKNNLATQAFLRRIQVIAKQKIINQYQQEAVGLQEKINRKLKEQEDLEVKVAKERRKRMTEAIDYYSNTNDVAGYEELMKQAKKYGDYLLFNMDASITGLRDRLAGVMEDLQSELTVIDLPGVSPAGGGSGGSTGGGGGGTGGGGSGGGGAAPASGGGGEEGGWAFGAIGIPGVDEMFTALEALQEVLAIKDEMITESGEKEKKVIDDVAAHRMNVAAGSLNVVKEFASAMTGLITGIFAAEIAAAEGNDKKQRQLRRKQAAAEKAMGIFQAGIGTALGIMKAITMFGPPPSPMGIAGIAIAAALGIAQTAMIAAKPLPKLAQGTPPGGMITNGPELIMVGDNASGRERVSVEPLDSRESGGMGGNTYNFYGIQDISEAVNTVKSVHGFNFLES